MTFSLATWLSDAALASWVQAVGSIMAIIACVAAVSWGHRLQVRADRRRASEEVQERLSRLESLYCHAWKLVNSLIRDPDKLGGLEEYWRDSSNNDPGLHVTRLEFCLDQLRAVPLMEVPVAGTGLDSIYELFYALTLAKSVLEREIEHGRLDQTAINRISDSLAPIKLLASKVVFRTHAQRRSIRTRQTID